MKHKRSTFASRFPLLLLSIFLGIILAAMINLTVQIPTAQAFATDSALLNQLSNPKPVRVSDDTVIGAPGTRVVNFLLIGQDRRENEGRTRSDSMILCTINKHTRQVTLTSFLRDLYVQIPGYGGHRLNSAYAFGGMELLDRTLEENFGLEIDGTIEVDFSQFSRIIDKLGGVTMELRSDEAALINEETGSLLTEGVQCLSGDQALCYSRIRKLDSDGDFSRTGRQRKVMGALLDAYRNISPASMFPLLIDIFPMITTDMGCMELAGYALELLPVASGFQFTSQHVPAPGSYQDQMIDGMAVLVPDLQAAREMLRQTLLEE